MYPQGREEPQEVLKLEWAMSQARGPKDALG